MKKITYTTLLILIICQIGFAQTNFDKAKLDKYFNVLEENNKFMGSVAVSKNGEIIYTKTIGLADVESNLKATENSKYRIGSISKTFTAVLVLKAVEEKKFDLNQTIDKWFPTITNAKKITIKHLLSHRSGVNNKNGINIDSTNDKGYLIWDTQPKTEKEMIEIIEISGSDFDPDSKAEYSNSNFVLLTYILEKTFAKSYSDLLQEFIIKPIGLTNTYVFGKINSSNNECKSYSFLGTWELYHEADFTSTLGAGGITSTPSDLVKIVDALFSGKLLKTESLEIMKTVKDGYGLGLFQVFYDERNGYGHSGKIDGFTSSYSHYADDKISYALFSNGTNIFFNDIAIAVLSAFFDKPYEIPVFTTYSLTSEDLNKYLGVYASKQNSMEITVTKKENILIGQVTGQPSFTLEATDKDKFKLDEVGAKFEFNPTDKTMILFQGGGQIEFIKE